MSDQEIILPAVLWMPKKGGKRENALNLNWYRNAHYIKLSQAKNKYYRQIVNKLRNLEPLTKVRPEYQYFLRQRSDVGNVHAVLEKFFLDSLVKAQVIEDDHCEIVSGGSYDFIDYDRNNPHCVVKLVTVQ